LAEQECLTDPGCAARGNPGVVLRSARQSKLAQAPMMSDEPRAQSVAVTVVYQDLPDLIEIETRVLIADWAGSARAYIGPSKLQDGARQLLEWSRQPTGEFEHEAGADTGIGWLHLRFYLTDKVGHVNCRVELATRSYVERRPEAVWRLAVEIPTELGLIDRFARQLASLAETFKGVAILEGVIG
jgi:hypothetical protein